MNHGQEAFTWNVGILFEFSRVATAEPSSFGKKRQT